MIKINSKTNKKLVQNFPQDPYSDIAIITKNQRLNLVLAYLGIDSNYFDTVDPDTKEVNLSQLEQEPLIRVLRSLYGAQLQSQSVNDLNQLYKIITALGVEDYKQNIVNEIKLHPNLMDSIEMLQFSFSHNILINQFKTHHFVSNLKILEDNRNYLQLNKVTPRTINQMLMQYEKSLKQKSHEVINNILQNFLNRNSLSPANYFNQQIQTLKMIWEKYHHTINYVQKVKTSDRIKASTIFGFESGRTSLTLGAQKSKIAMLEQQLQQKNRLISKLRQENLQLKRQLHFQRSKSLTQSQIANFSTYNPNHNNNHHNPNYNYNLNSNPNLVSNPNVSSSSNLNKNASFTKANITGNMIKQINESSQWSRQHFESTRMQRPKFIKKDQSGDRSQLSDRSGQFEVSSFETAFENSRVIKPSKQPQFINKINSRK